MKASDICKQAAELVDGDREQRHGDKVKNHENIASLWTGYLDTTITARDVACMMALLKIARTKAGSYNPDDYMDAVGYAAIAGELAFRREADKQREAAKANGPVHGAFGVGALYKPLNEVGRDAVNEMVRRGFVGTAEERAAHNADPETRHARIVPRGLT